MIFMRIAIIGGGAATVSLLHQLINKLSEASSKKELPDDHIEICIIEKQNDIGPGLAYSTTDHTHILNLPAKVMSPIPEDPKHFFNWAVANKTLWQKDFPQIDIEKCDFPPRALYGVYLKCLFSSLVQRAAAERITVTTLVAHEAIDIKRENHSNKLRVVFADPSTAPLLCDDIVLSIGHLDSDNYCEFKKTPPYLHAPWPVENLKRIPPDSSIFIAGTRLTAVDVLLSLKTNRHAGKIILGSRLGLLPCVIGNVDSAFNRKYLTLENIFALSDYGTKKLELNQVIELFTKELDADTTNNEAGRKKPFVLDTAVNPRISAVDFLKSEVEEVRSGISRHWQNVLFSLYSNISVIWDALSEDAKELFITKYYSAWMTYLAAFPFENAVKVLAMLESNEVVVKGQVQDVSYRTEDNKFQITFGDGTPPVICDYFINATGAGHNLERTPSLLLQNMVKSRLLIPYPLGGVKVEFKTLQPISDECVDGLYVMGDSGTYGACMATADLGQSGKQASRIANTIVEKLKTSLNSKKTNSSKRHATDPSPFMFKTAGRSLSAGNIEQLRAEHMPQQQNSLTTPQHK